jgi:hypothetical protein
LAGGRVGIAQFTAFISDSNNFTSFTQDSIEVFSRLFIADVGGGFAGATSLE